MNKVLITTIVAAALGLLATPTFAGAYFVNGHAASAAETKLLVSYGAQPGHWIVDGYGISPDGEHADAPSTERGNAKTCRYVLDVKLCD